MKPSRLAILGPIAFLYSCASTLVQHEFSPTPSISEQQYAQEAKAKGLVLVSANWQRVWNCGGYENAELRSIGFDRMPSQYSSDALSPDLVLNGSPGGSGIANFAYLVEPGEYGLSYFQIKVAESVSEVGYRFASRSLLLNNEGSKAGSFHIKAGEAVYIGHFGLDCAQQPIPWRYYLEDAEAFQKYVASFKKHYPYLELGAVQYRLFETREFGHPHELQ